VSSPFQHLPVLLSEAIDALKLQAGSVVVDCTAGGGGHSSEILRRLGPEGHLLSLDRDPRAVQAASERLTKVAQELGAEAPRWEVVHAAFSELDTVLEERGIKDGGLTGLLADLGVSSHQLDVSERGFSFMKDGPLDMRMDTSQGETAADLVNGLNETELADILFRLGDERRSRRIARALVERRKDEPFVRTADLAQFIESTLGGRRGAKTHPATRSFQALRMKVNGELDQLDVLLTAGLRWLKPGGRWVFITFHSGEDRPVKRRFTELSRECLCPPAQPICTCSHLPSLRLPRPWTLGPSQSEITANPRARSARLRIAERLSSPESVDVQ
jgi:16S rRNA (cytosine1402-N4)-methyltransferase